MCVSRATGKPLKAYLSEFEAAHCAEIASERYGNPLTYYECDDCGLYHLTPSDRYTPSTECHDCSWSGSYKAKKLYLSRAAAERRAEILFEERQVRLSVYPCPYHDGYHLTKG